MLNDRQRVELLLFPLLLKSILESGARRDAHYETCAQILDGAMIEIIGRLDDQRRKQIMRRTVRVHDDITDVTRKGGARVDKVALTVFYAMQKLLDAGALELDEGSDLSEAIHAIIHAFADAFEEARLDASARKHAAKMIERLQALGYFQPAPVERNAA